MKLPVSNQSAPHKNGDMGMKQEAAEYINILTLFPIPEIFFSLLIDTFDITIIIVLGISPNITHLKLNSGKA